MLKSGEMVGYLGEVFMVKPEQEKRRFEIHIRFNKANSDLMDSFSEHQVGGVMYLIDLAVDISIRTVLLHKEKGKN